MPNRDEIQNLQLAFALHRSGRFAEAAKLYRKVIKRNPKQPHALHSLGIIEAANGNLAEAARLMARSLSAEPANLDFMQNYATVLCQLGQFETARQVCMSGLAINGAHVYLLYVLAGTLLKLRQFEQSLAAYDSLLRLEPNHVPAITERSSVLLQTGQPDAAHADIERALRLDPNYADAHANRGLLFTQLKRYDEAIAAYQRATALNPHSAQGWTGYAAIPFALNRPAEALKLYDKALELEPDSVEALRGRAHCLTNLGRHEDAAVAYDRLYALKPDLPALAGLRLQARMHCCDWRDFDAQCASLIASIEANTDIVLPFDCLAIPSSLETRLKCSRSWTARNFAGAGEALWCGERYAHERIRIGYLSADFRRHPVAYLTAGLFEGHDRSRFEVIGISIGPNDGSDIRARLERGFDRFIDGAALADEAVAERIRAEEIDVLVDLNGFTIHARTAILARRPAPIQVNYLGFPGTMGAGFIDYIVADAVLIPPSHQHGYAEKVAYLPHSYMPHDAASRLISDRAMQRAEFGLPDRGVVFCCFNAAYKFNPELFQSWMRLLKAAPGSVLWLAECNATAEANLRRLTAAAGVDPARLVFARRLPSAAEHLARLRLADLFLDTWPYNAHTTASDALWVGLPVLTRIGDTFAGRVAASLVTAAGQAELIVESIEQFESTAIALATEPPRLAAIRERLTQNRPGMPLFDTRRYIGDLEAAYAEMQRRLQQGMRPEQIYVPG